MEDSDGSEDEQVRRPANNNNRADPLMPQGGAQGGGFDLMS